jgi:hypothetical protein
VQDDVPPFSDEEAFAIIQDQLGRPLEAVFSSISEQPVAAASLGQVCMYCWGGGMGVAGGGGGEVGPGGRSIQQHQPAACGSSIVGIGGVTGWGGGYPSACVVWLKGESGAGVLSNAAGSQWQQHHWGACGLCGSEACPQRVVVDSHQMSSAEHVSHQSPVNKVLCASM